MDRGMGGQSDGQLNKINSQASLTEEKTDTEEMRHKWIDKQR